MNDQKNNPIESLVENLTSILDAGKEADRKFQAYVDNQTSNSSYPRPPIFFPSEDQDMLINAGKIAETKLNELRSRGLLPSVCLEISRDDNHGKLTEPLLPIGPETPTDTNPDNTRFTGQSNQIQMTPNQFSPFRSNSAPLLLPLIEVEPESTLPTRKNTTNVCVLSDKVRRTLNLKKYEGSLYAYSNGYYKIMTDDQVRYETRRVLEHEIYNYGHPSLLNEVVSLLPTEKGLEDEPRFDPHIVSTLSGLLDLNHGMLYGHRPDYFTTTRLNIRPRWGEVPATPHFDDFLNQVTGGDPVLKMRIWEVIGYLISNDMGAKKIFVFQGVGNSGKSALARLISSMIDKESVSSMELSKFATRFGVSTLLGKKLHICMDMPDRPLSAEAVGILKELSGGDLVCSERKHKDATSFTNHARILIATNHSIRIQAQDDAFADRLLVIPFNFAVAKENRNPNLDSLLQEEKDGVGLKALYAYQSLARRNYNFSGGDAYCNVGSSAPAISMEDMVMRFVQTCCCLSPELYSFTKDLCEHFLQFCQSSGTPASMDTAAFSKLLHRTCGDAITPKKRRLKDDTINGYYGISLKAR